MSYERFDSVVAGDKFKGNRPFLVAATSTLSPRPSVALSLFTSIKKSRSGKDQRIHPGWLQFATGQAGLRENSYLRPCNILIVPETEIVKDIGTLPAEYHREYLSILESCIRPCEPGALRIPRGFVRSLPPPHLRAGIGNGSLAEIYAILRASGWKPPRQGDIMVVPSWWQQRPDRYYLVVSNTSFNQRYIFPEVLVVPLRIAADVREAETSNAPVSFEVFLTSKTTLYPFLEELFTFKFSLGYFGECPVCSKTSPYRFALPLDAGSGCVRCDRMSSAPWPRYVRPETESHESSMVATIHKLLEYLGVEGNHERK